MINIIQWNCRSLLPKIDSFKFLVHNYNCDAFALSETWLTKTDENLNFHNFNIIRQDRADGYGGVLLGIKKTCPFYRISFPSLSGIEVVAIHTQIKGKDITIASLYLPSSIRVSQRELKEILDVLPEPRLLLGDFNSHGTGWGEPKDDNRSTLIYNLCDNFNLTILNTGEVTRIARPPREGSRLDLSLCSRTLSLDCTWKVIQDPHGSDHLPIVTNIANGPRSPEPVNIQYDLTRNIDWKNYASIVSEGFEMVSQLPPLEEYEFIASLIHRSAVEAQTKPIPTSNTRKHPPSLWWDDECSKVYQDRSNAFVEFRSRHLIKYWDIYAALDVKFRDLIASKKRGYWRTFVDGLSRETSMRTLWNTARRMRNRAPTNSSDEYSDRWLFDFAKKVCPATAPARKKYRAVTPRNRSNDLETPFTMVELSLALLSCNNTAAGMDGIKFNLLKNLPDVAKRRLLNLFNKFLESNIVPHEWRQVKVIAIQKPGKPASDHNSYRPIAMLSCLRKLLEKMILFRLDRWVEDNGLLSDTQFGFRRGKGTNDCLALLSSEIQYAYAKKEEMASVFLDIKGAFDSVSIEVLSDKLHGSGLPAFINNYLYNLLSEKHMHFSHGNSSTCRISYMGLPQGSCLSPLLYNFYVNSIDNCLANGCTLRQLADDGVVSMAGHKATDLHRPLQDTLDNLSTWALELGIEFSPEKTELVVFSKKHCNSQLQLKLLGRTITQSTVFKYLGVWFDSKCTWECHIRYLRQKCQQRINFLRSITGTWWGAHPTDVIRLYQTTILSVLEYGSFCFRSVAKIHMIKLERIQYRCLRIALGCMHSTHTMSLEVLAGVLPLTERFYQLAFRTLIRCEIKNPLVITNFEKLLEVNPQKKFMAIYYDFITHEISPSAYSPNNRVASLTSYGSTIFFDFSMENEMDGAPEIYRSQIATTAFSKLFNHVPLEKMVYTDGSRLDEKEGPTGFGVFSEYFSAFHKLDEPCSVYVAELAAIYCALGFIEALPPAHYFIFSDSLSSLKALRSMKVVKHSSYFLLKIQEAMSTLVGNQYKLTFVWVPSHCDISGNDEADSLAKKGAMEGTTFERVITYDEFFKIARQETLVSWQTRWNEDELGRWLHSIIPKVSTRAWFKKLNVGRDFIRVFSRIMSNHTTLNAHLFRIGLSDSNLCKCGKGYHDIEHVVWACPSNQFKRDMLIDSLRAQGRQHQIMVPVRDILVGQDLPSLVCLYNFLKSVKVNI